MNTCTISSVVITTLSSTYSTHFRGFPDSRYSQKKILSTALRVKKEKTGQKEKGNISTVPKPWPGRFDHVSTNHCRDTLLYQRPFWRPHTHPSALKKCIQYSLQRPLHHSKLKPLYGCPGRLLAFLLGCRTNVFYVTYTTHSKKQVVLTDYSQRVREKTDI